MCASILGDRFRSKTSVPAITLALVLCVSVFAPRSIANAPPPLVKRTEALPEKLGNFARFGFAREIEPRDRDGAPREGLLSMIDTDYGFVGSPVNPTFHVSLNKWEGDSAAYADFTNLRAREGKGSTTPSVAIGTVSVAITRGIAFVKGNATVQVTNPNEKEVDSTVELARLIADSLPAGEDEIPVLVKHLPQWERAEANAIYFVEPAALRQAVTNEPVLDVVGFEGGTEAVVANYDRSQLVIVEFTTPQISIDNDSRIWTKIAELKSQGQPTPSAYRRVGNYSVFVFNAPDEKTANALIEQVKYEQVVQWLGDDPHLYQKLQRYFTQTSAGVLVAVLKSSGLSLILCLAIGGAIGALLFWHRRAQRAATFSDAGGSIRLNLDELTGSADTRRLLSAGEKSRKDPA